MPKPRDPNRPKKQARPGQKDGYCLPPESSRIKPGEVRNPWGPKGKPKPAVEDPYEIAMSQTTKSNINGVPTDISVELGIHLVHAQKALAGSTASYNALIKARPGRGHRFETMKAAEQGRLDEEKKKNIARIQAKMIALLDHFAEQKKRFGDSPDMDDGPGDDRGDEAA